MLTGSKILEEIKNGNIIIDPFEPTRVNPNSYNLRIGDTLKMYDLILNKEIDSKKTAKTIDIMIPPEGYVLRPNKFYLASTIEYTATSKYIPSISGRSSIARLGIEIHRTAGFGDIGFNGRWTLEITAQIPVRIYAGQEICQIYYEVPDGDTDIQYCGKYQLQSNVTESKMYLDEK